MAVESIGVREEMMTEAADLFASAARRLHSAGLIVGDADLPVGVRISLAAAQLDAAQRDAAALVERLAAVRRDG